MGLFFGQRKGDDDEKRNSVVGGFGDVVRVYLVGLSNRCGANAGT